MLKKFCFVIFSVFATNNNGCTVTFDFDEELLFDKDDFCEEPESLWDQCKGYVAGGAVGIVALAFWWRYLHKSEPVLATAVDNTAGAKVDKQIYSPSSNRGNRCLLFSVANALSFEEDFVWPEAGIPDTDEGMKMDRIEKSRLIVNYLDAEFVKYAEGQHANLAQKLIEIENSSSIASYDKKASLKQAKKNYDQLRNEAINSNFVYADTFFEFLRNRFPVENKKFENLFSVNNENVAQLENFCKDNVVYAGQPEKSAIRVDCFFSQDVDRCRGFLNNLKSKECGSIIINIDNYHFVCIHFDRAKKELICCDDCASENPNSYLKKSSLFDRSTQDTALCKSLKSFFNLEDAV